MDKLPVPTDRSDLITTAVKFLNNPSVWQTPYEQKRAFLVKKGLTENEVNKAFELCNAASFDAHSQLVNSNSLYSGSSWYRTFKDSLILSSIVATGSFAVYHIYKNVIKPRFFSPEPQNTTETGQTSLDAQSLFASVNGTLLAVQDTLKTVQTTLTQQQYQIDTIKHSLDSNQIDTNSKTLLDSKAFNDLKSEVTSVKSLLLSRNQFAPNPAIAPVLPSWQLPESSQLESDKIPQMNGDINEDMNCMSNTTDEVTALDNNE